MNLIPDQPILTGDQILPYIPQRPPMVFVDTFYGLIDNALYSSLLVTPDMVFVEDGKLLDIGLIEFLTQSGYVWFSYREKVILQKGDLEITKGYLCKIKNVHVSDTPSIGTRIYSRMDVIFFSSSFSTIHMTAYTEDGTLAEGDFDVISLN
jgi:predicted hotdog family 3-hydroxylacyl-ACP dehydratase